MIEIMNPVKETMKAGENCLDPRLWHACAGGMVQMPPINSNVIYFPQGHIEHAQVTIDFKTYPRIPPLLPCRISSIKYLADRETDEVYAKIRLEPLKTHEFDFGDDGFAGDGGSDHFDGLEKPASFAKTLTQSDANNGGGFSVPRYCAETIFPRLDYSAEPPVQTILAKDVHGVTWKFRHIYRGTPRRHLLTTGWSNFVNQKKLVAGDSIVFLRAGNGDLRVGIRRAKKGIGGGPESPSGGWNGGYSTFLRDDDSRMLRGIGRVNSGLGPNGKVGVESIVEAVNLAANGEPFEAVYYPRASTPEFCVKTSAVRAAMQIRWCSGMRFKMAFETEDSSRISWFMGTISGVQVADPIHWCNSPWRLLQVAWDEPELLQNVKRVNPWLVEVVASIPTIHMSPFSPQRKKPRLLSQPGFPFIDQLPVPPFPNNPFCRVSDNISAGIQGARHAQFQQPLATFNKMHFGLFPGLNSMSKPEKVNENVSCVLTIGSHSDGSKKSDDCSVRPRFMLFGKAIVTEEHVSQSSYGDSVKGSNNSCDGSINGPADSSSDEVLPRTRDGPYKVLLDKEDVGRALDLSMLGDKPFSEFLKTARTLTFLDLAR